MIQQTEMLPCQGKQEYPGSGKDYLLDYQGQKINAAGQAGNKCIMLIAAAAPSTGSQASWPPSWAELISTTHETKDPRGYSSAYRSPAYCPQE